MASLHELAEAERASDGPPLLPTLIEAPALPAGSCIQTRSRNLVHRKATVCGAQHVVIDGRSIVHEGVVLRGDLAKISIGRFTTLGPHAILRPPHRLVRDEDRLHLDLVEAVAELRDAGGDLVEVHRLLLPGALHDVHLEHAGLRSIAHSDD